MHTLYMPSDRVIVLSGLPASQLEAVFRSDGTTPGVPAGTVTLIRSVQENQVWAVTTPEGLSHATTGAPVGKDAKKDPLKPLADAVAGSQGAAAWASLDGERVKLGINVACADEAGAARTAKDAEAAWKDQTVGLDKVKLLALALIAPKTVAVYNELSKSLTFSADGTTARATASLDRKTLADAAGELQALQHAGGMLGGGGMPNIGVFPGGGNPK
jgi:hypothetical protein